MDILTKKQHRALAFVDSCNRSGYLPTPNELTLWLDAPAPEDSFRRTAGTLNDMLNYVTSSALSWGSNARESLVDHLVRLTWLAGYSRLEITALGTALLRSAERAAPGEGSVDVVALDRDDPLSYPRLLGRIAAIEDAILVDPYLKLDQLHELVQHTTVSRILISKQYKGSGENRAAMAVYLGSQGITRGVEVRASADTDVHDRFVANADQVQMVGHSLNGVARKTASTLVVALPEPAASAQRERIERWWADSEPVAPVGATEPELPIESVEPAPESSSEA